MTFQQVHSVAPVKRVDDQAVSARRNNLTTLEFVAQRDMSHIAHNLSVFILRHPAKVPMSQLFVSGVFDPQVFPFFERLAAEAVARLDRGNVFVIFKMSFSEDNPRRNTFGGGGHFPLEGPIDGFYVRHQGNTRALLVRGELKDDGELLV